MPNTVTFGDVCDARARLDGVANRTPVMTSRTLDAIAGRRVFLKCENMQRGGAFKFRGAYNAISRLDDDARSRGVAAFSSGNHAQGVALAARLLGTNAVICMPSDAPTVKVAATREYGAEALFYDRHTVDREAFGRGIAAERGLTLIPPYDHPAIIAGQGTCALEFFEDVPELDTLLVPISGGGLIAGVGIAAHGVKPSIQVLGVEPQDADDTRRSLASGERVQISTPATVADGLRVTIPGALTFPLVQRYVAGVLTISDDQILDAVRFALLRLKLVVEPSGAVGLASVLAGLLPAEAECVGLVISGGNIDPPLLAQLMAGG